MVGVAGCCRDAVEAACLEVLRRSRIGRGSRHEDVDRAWADARTTIARVSLALFDDAGRTADVYARLNRAGSWATPCLKALNAGSHGSRSPGSGSGSGSGPHGSASHGSGPRASGPHGSASHGGAGAADLVGDTERLVREVRRS